MIYVALIFGGPGSEHEVSLCSAKNILDILEKTSFGVRLLAVTKKKLWRLIGPEDLKKTSFQNPIDVEAVGFGVELFKTSSGVFIKSKEGPSFSLDCAFPIIHGSFGEDGKLQSLLNELGLDFTGSPALGCERAFDKVLTKKIISQTSVPQLPYLSFISDFPDFDEVVSKLGLPFFVKPARTGSSIGISKVTEKGDFEKSFFKALEFDKKVLVEKAVVGGRELECAVLEEGGLKTTGLGEIKTGPKHGFYSYEAKYLDTEGGGTDCSGSCFCRCIGKNQKLQPYLFQKTGLSGLCPS